MRGGDGEGMCIAYHLKFYTQAEKKEGKKTFPIKVFPHIFPSVKNAFC